MLTQTGVWLNVNYFKVKPETKADLKVLKVSGLGLKSEAKDRG